MFRSFMSGFAMAVVFAAMVATSLAGTIFVDPVNHVSGPYAYTYAQAGYGFHATALGTAQVNRLGYADESGTGLLGAHTVALYDYDGLAGPYSYTMIAKATIPAGTVAPLDGGYRWVSIPTVTLSDTGCCGDYYVVMASYNGADQTYEGSNSVTATVPGAIFGSLTGHGWYINSIGNVGQTSIVLGLDSLFFGANWQYGGANLGYAVPEPGSLSLLAFGISVMTFVWRRRVKRA